jgi:hypothetical protein
MAITVVPIVWYIREAWIGRQRTSGIAKQIVLYSLVAFAMAFPFYFRPCLLTGNPFYPYYAQWFSIDPSRLEMSRFHHSLGSAFGMSGLLGFLGGPLLLAVADSTYDGSYGWQLLIVIGLALLALRAAFINPIRRLLFFSVGVFGWLYLFWFFTAQQARFALPAMLALWIVATAGLSRLRGKQRQIVLALLLMATIISLPWRTAGHYLGSWLAAAGIISNVDYVNVSTDGNQTYVPLLQAIAEHTPKDARVMLLHEHRGLYVPRQHLIGTPFFQEANFTPPEKFTEPQAILESLRSQRITHIVVSKTPSGPDVLAGWIDRTHDFFTALDQCVQQGKLVSVWESERYLLLAVQPKQ